MFDSKSSPYRYHKAQDFYHIVTMQNIYIEKLEWENNWLIINSEWAKFKRILINKIIKIINIEIEQNIKICIFTFFMLFGYFYEYNNYIKWVIKQHKKRENFTLIVVGVMKRK